MSTVVTAGFFKGEALNCLCTEPHIQPLAGYFGGTIQTANGCIDNIKRLIDVMNGTIPQVGPGYGNATYFTFQKDLVTMDDLGSEGEYTCTLHPLQLIRLLSRFHHLLTQKEPTLMEVEIYSYYKEYPYAHGLIPPNIKELPLIRLSDPIPLPPEIGE